MHKVSWTREAESDLEIALSYYLQEGGAKLAESVYSRVREQVASLQLFPQRCRVGRVPGTHEYVLARLPYVAVVAIGDRRVTVLALVHTARKFP